MPSNIFSAVVVVFFAVVAVVVLEAEALWASLDLVQSSQGL